MKSLAFITLFLSLLCFTIGCAQLIEQPATVTGLIETHAASSADTDAPQEATHTESKRGNWRIYDGKLPTLEQLEGNYIDPMPIYGLYTAPELYLKFRDDIKAVGFSSFRVWGGQLEKADPGIKAMIEDDVQIMLVLGSEKRDEFDSDEAYIENALATFARTIERYGPDGQIFKENPDLPYRPLTHFQVLNEPNFQYMYVGTGGNEMIPVRHKLYAKLLPRTYDMIKKRWPEITVVGFTCGGAAAQDLFFVKNALKANPDVANAFDVFSTHPYSQPAPPDVYAVQPWGEYSLMNMLTQMRREFAKAGRPISKLPVWYTEGGWRLKPEAGGMFKSGTHDADMHAACYVRYYAIALRMGVNRVMPMYTADADTFNGGIFNRDEDWNRNNDNPMRPVAYAIQNMIKLMPNPKIKSIICDGTDGYFAYTITNDKLDPNSKTTIMAWHVTGAKQVTIPVKTQSTTIIDMYGKQITAQATNNSSSATVGPYPIYITE